MLQPEDCTFESFGPAHDREAFSCGVEPLDRYLKQQATQDIRRHLAAVYVMCPIQRPIPPPVPIVGFYSLSAYAIDPADLPEDQAKRLPRRKAPAVLLGRLAVDGRYQGQKLGGHLLMDALQRSLRAEIAAMAVIVDAKDDAARSFYEHYGFQRFPEQPRRLFLTMGSIEDLFRDASEGDRRR